MVQHPSYQKGMFTSSVQLPLPLTLLTLQQLLINFPVYDAAPQGLDSIVLSRNLLFVLRFLLRGLGLLSLLQLFLSF